jgi:hypothetical protein
MPEYADTGRLQWVRTRWGRVAAAAGVAAVAYLGSLIPGPIGDGLMYLAILAFALASVLFWEAIGLYRWISRSVDGYFRFASEYRILGVGGPLGIILITFAIRDQGSNWAIFWLTIAGLLLPARLYHLTTETGRKEVFDTLKKYPIAAVFIYLAIALFYLMLFFASVTLLLAKGHLIEFQGESPTKLGSVFDFYAWTFADSVPYFEISKTVKLNEPLQYTDLRVGFLVLAFKLIAAAPVVAAAGAFWQLRKDRQAQPQQTQGNTEPASQ